MVHDWFVRRDHERGPLTDQHVVHVLEGLAGRTLRGTPQYAGAPAPVCELERNGDVKRGFARSFIRNARTGDELRKEPKAVEGLVDASTSRNCQGL